MKLHSIAAGMVLAAVVAATPAACGGSAGVSPGGGGTAALVWTNTGTEMHPHWAHISVAAALGAGGGIVAARALKHSRREIFAKFSQGGHAGGQCPGRSNDWYSRRPGHILGSWSSNSWTHDIFLRCETYKKWGRGEELISMLRCITLIITNGVPGEFRFTTNTIGWRGGYVTLSHEGEIIKAEPPTGQTWEECASGA